ncbi:MAG: hypothetical protein PUK36_00380 [Prevotella sp.]|nr:hypothetical protein [Prevotella sp.]
MAQIKVKIPKGSWLDQKGQRWMKVFFDVMFGFGGGGEKFIRQISLDFTCNFDFRLKKYVVNINGCNLRDIVLQKYPSLERYGDFHLVMTTRRI